MVCSLYKRTIKQEDLTGEYVFPQSTCHRILSDYVPAIQKSLPIFIKKRVINFPCQRNRQEPSPYIINLLREPRENTTNVSQLKIFFQFCPTENRFELKFEIFSLNNFSSLFNDLVDNILSTFFIITNIKFKSQSLLKKY